MKILSGVPNVLERFDLVKTTKNSFTHHLQLLQKIACPFTLRRRLGNA
jgi:hypothetical protein